MGNVGKSPEEKSMELYPSKDGMHPPRIIFAPVAPVIVILSILMFPGGRMF